MLGAIAIAPNLAEAFRRCGLTYYDVNGQVMNSCTPSYPNYPQCYDPQVPCSGGEVQPLPVPCDPNSTSFWFHCNTIIIPAPSNPTGGTTNSCGCYINEESDMPSGCIQVEDTQLGWEGVSTLKIYVKDLYFFGRETKTTGVGCWAIHHRYFGGIHPFIHWHNNQASFRAIRGLDYSQLVHHLKQNCGLHGGGVYNDFQVKHHRFIDDSKIERAHWYASTAMNALYEFNAFAYHERIGYTRGGTQVWLTNHPGAASAPMLNYLEESPRGNYDFNDLMQAYSDIILYVMFPVMGYTVQVAHNNPPDVTYFYGQEDLTSDVIKETFYHEYAHVSHCRGLSQNIAKDYWVANIERTLLNSYNNDNPPYGSPTTTGAGRCAVMESWASHIGSLFADMNYGVENFASASMLDEDDKEKNRFIYRRLERFNPKGNSPDAWMPDGIYWDMMDDNTHNKDTSYIGGLGIRDLVADTIQGVQGVQGVSNFDMFKAVTQNAPTDILTVRDYIKTAYPNQAVQIDSLYKEYGY